MTPEVDPAVRQAPTRQVGSDRNSTVYFCVMVYIHEWCIRFVCLFSYPLKPKAFWVKWLLHVCIRVTQFAYMCCDLAKSVGSWEQ